MNLASRFIVVSALALAACSKTSEATPESKASTHDTPTVTSAAATTAAPATAAPVGASTDVVLPKLGDIKAVEWEDLKKKLADAGWNVSGSATKSAMYSISATLTKGENEIKLSYYRDGGSFWKKRLEKDGAAIHEEGNVLIGVVVSKGGADPKKVLASMI